MDLLALPSAIKFMVTGGVLAIAVIIDAVARRQRHHTGVSERPAHPASIEGLDAGLEKMHAADMPEAALRAFACYYEELRDGHAGVLPESRLEPVCELPSFDELPRDQTKAREALGRTIVLKLNGGLGTTMGLKGPKSLLEVKRGLTFLDLIACQMLSIRRRAGRRVPLVLMNSFATDGDTRTALHRYPDLAADVAITFVQNSFPKLRADDLMPVSWPENRLLEWAPPGRGER